ncbi:MAG: hypothetical protein ACOVQ2_10465 [Flavobacterium sp.]
MKIIFTLITSYILIGCTFFYKKDEDQEKFSDLVIEIDTQETKKFNYLKELIHYKTGYNQDTIKIILKEYYKDSKDYKFYKNSDSLIYDLHFGRDKTTKIDFINKIEKKHLIKRKVLYMITNEIDFFFKMEKISELETVNE